MTDNAAETPFTELMARIPRGEALSWYESNGLGAYCHAPVGEYVHRALALITTQAAEIAALREQLKQTQLGGALRDDYNEKRLNATIASQAAEIERLRELLQSAYVRSSIEEGSPLGVEVCSYLRGYIP